MIRHSRLILVVLGLLIMASPALSQYVGSKKSNKYHEKTCRYVKNIHAENKIEFETNKDAEDIGYIACKVCKPGSETVKKEDKSTKSSDVSSKSDSGVKTESVDRQKKNYWLNTNSNVRHNSSCRWYGNTKRGKWVTKSSGRACGNCGG